MKAIKAIYKKDLERLQAENKEMKEALRNCLVKLDIAHNEYNVPCRAEIKEIISLLKK